MMGLSVQLKLIWILVMTKTDLDCFSTGLDLLSLKSSTCVEQGLVSN